jgi:hypothetical protein
MATATLQIPLEDLSRPEWRPLYVSDRPRYATVGAVRFLDVRTIVCSSLLGQKICLIRFDLAGGHYEILDRADTATQTDLCDTDGRGLVIVSTCEAAGMSLYRRVDDKIHFERDLGADLPGNYCHGARFCGPDVVVATTLRDPLGAHFFDAKTMRKLLHVKTDHSAKDICFLPHGRAALITVAGSPTTKPGESYRSEILLVEIDLSRGRYKILEKKQSHASGQLDSIVAHDDRLFVVDSYRGCVLVLDASTLEQVDQINGYDFPHGIDINHGMMAIACYGTNSIHVSSLRT